MTLSLILNSFGILVFGLFGKICGSKYRQQPTSTTFIESVDRLSTLTGACSIEGDALNITTFQVFLNQLYDNLIETRRREQAIFEKAVDVICIIDVEGRFLSVSPSVERAWGFTTDEIIGTSLANYIIESDSPKSLVAALGSPHSIDKITFDNVLKNKEGKPIYLSWSAHWSAKDNGLFCVARDISERKDAELRLQDSEKRLRTTLEAMPIGVASLHQSGNVEYANSTLKRFIAKNDADLLAFPINMVVPENERAKFHKFLQDCKVGTANGSQSTELTLIRNSKLSESQTNSVESDIAADLLPVEVTATPFSVQTAQKLLVTFVDIAHRKQVERIRNEFISMINHDLRTPLNSLSGLIALIENDVHGTLSDRGKQLCRLAGLEIDRLIRLVNDLLDLERLESGKFAVQANWVSVLDLVEAAVSSVQIYAQLRNIRLVYQESDAACWADRARIIQVLVNLISNAIKYADENSEVKIFVGEENGKTKFAVEDEGRGITDSQRKLLFERFSQIQPNDPAERAGFGLGLSICKAIINAHNGEISCSSSPGFGSTFWFTLPLPNPHS